MHYLDLIMYIVIVLLLWFALHKLSEGEYTTEIGGIVGYGIELIFTVIYIIIFVWPIDLNWSDIFNGTAHSHLHISVH